MKKIKKNDNVTVIGRRWFDRVYGNTYHSVEVYVNGELVGSNPFEYGYDNQYEQTAGDILAKNFKLPFPNDGLYHSLWQLKNYGVKFISSVSDVERKKDL